MRNVLIYILLVATLLPSVSSWGVIAHYQLNKEYIARVLCENRDKPQMHCNGQCYLAKQLKANQEKQAKEMAGRMRHLPTVVLFCADLWAFEMPALPALFSTQPRVPYGVQPSHWPPKAVFQPPQGV